MSKVYVIFRGEHEDRVIEAIFSTLQDAEITTEELHRWIKDKK